MYNSSLGVIFRKSVAFRPRIAVVSVISLEDSDWNASMPRHTDLCFETIKKRDDTHDNHEMPLCPRSKPWLHIFTEDAWYSTAHPHSTRWKKESHSVVWDSATSWTVAHQAPLSMGFSRQENWSGLPFPSPGDLLKPGIDPGSPSLQADSLPCEPPGKPFSTTWTWGYHQDRHRIFQHLTLSWNIWQ